MTNEGIQLVVSDKMIKVLEGAGVITNEDGKIIAKINEARIELVKETTKDERRFVVIDQREMLTVLGDSRVIGVQSEVEVGPAASLLMKQLEIRRFDHFAPNMIDHGFYEPKPKWNDAPAWTPGGGAPRRRGKGKQ